MNFEKLEKIFKSKAFKGTVAVVIGGGCGFAVAHAKNHEPKKELKQNIADNRVMAAEGLKYGEALLKENSKLRSKLKDAE